MLILVLMLIALIVLFAIVVHLGQRPVKANALMRKYGRAR